MLKQLNLTYALKNNKLVHISEVEHGLACDCTCPACGEILIAKKGQKVMHHFAHQTTKNCEYGYETSLHLAAKEILSKAKKMIIPPVYIEFPNSYKKDILLSEAKEITIDHVELEQRFDNVVPDVVVYACGKPFFVEIFVTHCIDDEKLNKLKKLGVSTIEIDLSKFRYSITAEELTTILIDDSNYKYWKYNTYAEKYLWKFYHIADKRNISISKTSGISYVYGCPLLKQSWINVMMNYQVCITDCFECPYCIAYSFDNNNILCVGNQRISLI